MSPHSSIANPVSAVSTALARTLGISLYRCQMLAYKLSGAEQSLARERPGATPGEHLDAYLRLRWLRWDRGRLRLNSAEAQVRGSAG